MNTDNLRLGTEYEVKLPDPLISCGKKYGGLRWMLAEVTRLRPPTVTVTDSCPLWKGTSILMGTYPMRRAQFFGERPGEQGMVEQRTAELRAKKIAAGECS